MTNPTETTAQNTDAIQQQYQTDGFYIPDGPILPDDIVAAATTGMDAVREGRYDTGQPPQTSRWNPGDDPDELCKIELPQQADLGIRALVSHPDLGRWAARVTGAKMVQVWWTQLLYKPPQRPGVEAELNIGWHQDRHYWQAWAEGCELFTAWVALSDVAADTGPMRFVRGSNQWGLLDDGGFFRQDLDDQRADIPVPDGQNWEEQPALLPPGGASFHHCLTFHGSSANTSAGPRRSLAIHMRTEKSAPVDDARAGLTAFIDDPERNPVIYQE
ncbi:MAG: hypothetical protein GKR89_33055 [Candidatus Latescibacteria bacterium]|nr:hypothetical protein [Candidatus Latescibacterota bacterium]